jgi:hypothetical protein
MVVWTLENGEGLWQDIVRIKYVKNSPTCLIPTRLSDSPIWSDLMKMRHIYLKGRGVKAKMDKMLVSGWIPGCMIVPYVLHILFCMMKHWTRNVQCMMYVPEDGWFSSKLDCMN